MQIYGKLPCRPVLATNGVCRIFQGEGVNIAMIDAAPGLKKVAEQGGEGGGGTPTLFFPQHFWVNFKQGFLGHNS